MLLFVAGQYAGGQYLAPLANRWGDASPVSWKVVTSGPSANYLKEQGIAFERLTGPPATCAASVLDATAPSLVVLSASVGDEYERAFVIEAKKRGVPTARALDMWSNYRERFLYDGEMVLPDYILAMDERCAWELEEDGIPSERIRIIGQPYLEQVAAMRPPLGENVLLPGQPIAKYWQRNLGYDERDFWTIVFAGIQMSGEKNVVATRHPDEGELPESRFSWTQGRGLKDVSASHTVLGMYSMQMMVGYLWGRKVASVQPGLEVEDPCPLSRWGMVPILQTPKEVSDFLLQSHDQALGNDLREMLEGSLDRLEAFCLEHVGH